MNSANIIITHKCNLNCLHCYMNANNKSNENYDEIFSRFKNIICKLKNMDINEILLTGGECTISPIVMEILNYCKDNNIKTSIFTNGIFFNEKILDYVDSYFISVDGLEKNHNYLRQNSNAYGRTIETIKKLVIFKKKVTVQITITNKNINDLLPTIKKLYSLGVKNINISSLLNDGRSKSNKIDYNINLKKINKIVKDAYRETGYNVKIHTNIFNQFDTNIFLKNRSIIFPIWIDLINNSFYLIKDDSIFSKNIDEFSKENLNSLNNSLYEYIFNNIDNIFEKKMYVLENEVINSIGGKVNE